MRKSRFSEEQTVAMLREADQTLVAEVARKHKAVFSQEAFTTATGAKTADRGKFG